MDVQDAHSVSPERLLHDAGYDEPGADPDVHWRSLMLALIAILRRRATLPPVGRAALDDADAVWSGRRPVEDLEPHNTACWEYADAKQATSNQRLGDDEDRSLRALFCVLGPLDEYGSVYETADWFAGMINALER